MAERAVIYVRHVHQHGDTAILIYVHDVPAKLVTVIFFRKFESADHLIFLIKQKLK